MIEPHRPSMYSQVVVARMLAAAVCPRCEAKNERNQKATIDLSGDVAYCNACGETFRMARPTAEAV
jgi:transcription elongation factor Elf1